MLNVKQIEILIANICKKFTVRYNLIIVIRDSKLIHSQHSLKEITSYNHVCQYCYMK